MAIYNGTYTGGSINGNDFSGDTLSGSFFGVNFRGRNLQGATFSGIFLGCDFSDADLTGAGFPFLKQLGNTFTGAIMPDGSIHP